ncbi:protein lifeguard 4-like [Haliotis asinina]|uniref:protein lifeguard 4-like n=1 Tax=Haliotis asinina TaxID=109174 RepID=UPI003531BB00
MATFGQPKAKEQGKESIVDDFMYGSNVASAHVYIRMGFLRKVYGILTTQILLTVIVSALFMSNEGVQKYIHSNQWMMTVSLFGTFIVIFALMWKRHETPTNYILLGVFTLLEAYTIGVIVTFYTVSSVIEAFVLTLGVFVVLTLYTLQSKRDFSAWGASLFSFLWILILAGFMQILFPSVMMDKAIAVGGALLFSLFIIFDTHLLMHKLSAEEYIVAAVNLYLDIINLFLHLLRLFGERK